MEKFSLADAVTLFSQEVSNITTLWAFYTAAAFAAAGFATTDKSKFLTGVVVTIGFWLFTLGHLALLRAAIIT
jgi:hypothetical protein